MVVALGGRSVKQEVASQAYLKHRCISQRSWHFSLGRAFALLAKQSIPQS